MMGQLFSGIASAWLLTSVLLWDHGPVQATNAIVIGVVALALLPASYLYPRLRYAIAAAGYWLSFSSLTIFFFSDSALTAANHIATGAVMYVSAIGPFSGIIRIIPPRRSAPADHPDSETLPKAA